ncbi:hypothetical protein CLV84_2066 [Neolewinella xylanilytica]|uniref:Uncharacterized protein n=1 Tax=Neolewinella xylanilytica TaxID=1514080 RepID=A0A2S6I1X5_9BACT|nr:hypothetical protein [Neolewinella xylanilytica]PPK85174.1 hypothetical protein CLV84_2066 [Neolewinella xylanilytica]
MTLNDLLRYAADHPDAVIFYFTLIPFAALLAGFMEREESHLPPWNYLYSALLYLVAVPAILATGLMAYKWLFERGSILDADLVLQGVPIASFFGTAYIIRRQVYMPGLPGFGRLGGLVVMIFATLVILWIIDRTRIVVFSGFKIQYLLVVFLLLLILVRFGWRKVFA